MRISLSDISAEEVAVACTLLSPNVQVLEVMTWLFSKVILIWAVIPIELNSKKSQLPKTLGRSPSPLSGFGPPTAAALLTIKTANPATRNLEIVNNMMMDQPLYTVRLWEFSII